MRKNKRTKRIYLDHASSTPVDMHVQKVLATLEREVFGNASALHREGVVAQESLEMSRTNIARVLDAHGDEIVFTSGGTESNNLALQGVLWAAFAHVQTRPHIVTTNIEHASVLETCRLLERTGHAEVTYVPVEASGIVDPKKIREALRPNTVLVSVMYANNEIGTIQPIRDIAKVIRRYRTTHIAQRTTEDTKSVPRSTLRGPQYPLLHTDACQATNYLPLSVEHLGIDLMTLNSSKIYGPKGIGILYVKRKTPLVASLVGGSQEFGMRAGTESVPLVGAFAEALTITEKMKEKENKRLTILRDFLFEQLTKHFPKCSINGDLVVRLPSNVNVSFPHFSSELLVIELDAKGFAVSSKSACEQDDPDESYVLAAIGAKKEGEENGSLRITLGRSTTKQDLIALVQALKEIFMKYKSIVG